jgi:uncharacterized protein
VKHQPLTDYEYNRFGNLLDRLPGEDAMNLEEADGFFAALICAPETVLPSEYLREIWGGGLDADEPVFSRQELEELLHLNEALEFHGQYIAIRRCVHTVAA